jgi:hypothetical protein
MFVVLDRAGIPWGPFDDAAKAGAWAHKKWPEQPANDARSVPHREGWNVSAVRHPDAN